MAIYTIKYRLSAGLTITPLIQFQVQCAQHENIKILVTVIFVKHHPCWFDIHHSFFVLGKNTENIGLEKCPQREHI